MKYLEIMKNGIMEHLKKQEVPWKSSPKVLDIWISVNLLLIIFYLWMWECAMAWPAPHVCPSVAGLRGISYLSPRCIRVEPATALTHHLQNCRCETRLISPAGALPRLTCNSSTRNSVAISGPRPSWKGSCMLIERAACVFKIQCKMFGIINILKWLRMKQWTPLYTLDG